MNGLNRRSRVADTPHIPLLALTSIVCLLSCFFLPFSVRSCLLCCTHRSIQHIPLLATVIQRATDFSCSIPRQANTYHHTNKRADQTKLEIDEERVKRARLACTERIGSQKATAANELNARIKWFGLPLGLVALQKRWRIVATASDALHDWTGLIRCERTRYDMNRGSAQ